MKKKILVLTSTFPRWKNDTTPPFVFNLSKRLSKSFNITVLAPHFARAKTFELMDGLSVYRFRYFFSPLEKLTEKGGILPTLKRDKLFYLLVPFFFTGELIETIRVVLKDRPDIIHSHWIIPQGLIAVIIKKIFNIPYIVTSHGGDIFALQGKLFIELKLVILNNAKGITVVSSAIKNEVIRINPNLKPKIQIIPMGVDSKLFNPNKYSKSLKKKYNPDGPILLFVGRLAEKKGVEYLIKAMSLVIKINPKVKLLIIGSGTLENNLKELTHKLNLDKYVVFISALSNNELPKYYATADIFIGPSIKAKGGDTEGFGLTFVEALFSGTKVIGTNVGGIRDIIGNKELGIIVKQKKYNEVANEIIRLLPVGKNSRIKIENMKGLFKFDWNNISFEYVRLINKLTY